MDINFFMPTRVVMGKDVVIKNYELFKGLGEKALVVTGKTSSKKNGSLKDVEEALKKAEIEYVIFDEIEENPSLETIDKASAFGIKEGVDFVIGIGGGSPLDASKAIAVMIKNPHINKDNVFTSGELSALDVLAVPTTSGTGSETTQYSIVTDHKRKTKINLGQRIFPKIAFLDATYTEGMNKNVTINTAIDALTHIVEGYLNVKANVLTDGLVGVALNIWGQCIPALQDGDISFEVREKLMLASTMGGMIIAQVGTSLPHGMGYPLTYFKGVPHGLANGCLYVEYLGIFKNRDRVNNVYKMLGLQSYEELEGILRNLCKIDIEITSEEIAEYTTAMIDNKAKLKNHPEEVSYEDIYSIYEKSLFNIKRVC